MSTLSWRSVTALAVVLAPVLILTTLQFAAPLPPTAQAISLALAVLWLAAGLVHLQNKLTAQLQRLVYLVQGLRGGDYAVRVRGGLSLLSGLQSELNALADQLGNDARRWLETDALLAQLLAALDVAVLIVDEQDRLVDMNPAAEQVLQRDAGSLLGKTATDLGFTQWLEHPVPFIDRDTGIPQEGTTPGRGSWEVRRLSFRRRGRPHRLLVVTDVSRALREQERHAWRRLIRVLGHEINNSLGSIQSTAGLLLERSKEADPQRTSLELIERRARALGAFIRRYAELARLPPPSPEPVDVAALIRHVSSLETRVPLTLEPGIPLTSCVDPLQLEQALINLIRNAADAALETAGSVTVRWRQEGRFFTIEVEDDGPGLAHTDNLFVPFFTTKPGGSGVGLALASQIIEAHGGSLRLLNKTHARGALALVRLPA